MAAPSFVYLTLLSLVGTSLVVAKLVRTKLHRHYRVFFLYFAFRIVNLSVATVADVTKDWYAWYFLFSTLIVWSFYLLVVRELVGLILEKYVGLRTFGRWFLYVAIIVSAIISFASLLPKITPATPLKSKGFIYVLAIDRGVTFSLVVFLLLLLIFLSRYPVPLGRNVLVHAGLFTAFFLTSTFTSLLKSVFGQSVLTQVDLALVGFGAACTFGWFFLLSAKGEEVKMSLPHFSPEQEERILYKLDALNATLLKVGGK